jgi:hypothetical protein
VLPPRRILCAASDTVALATMSDESDHLPIASGIETGEPQRYIGIAEAAVEAARREVDVAKRLISSLTKPLPPWGNKRTQRIWRATIEAGDQVVVAIVFCAMSAEAEIFAYASRNLSASFAKTYLDKLDVISKWVLIPKLVAGKEIAKSTKAFQIFKEMIKQRNAYVHAKPRSLHAGEEMTMSEDFAIEIAAAAENVAFAEKCLDAKRQMSSFLASNDLATDRYYDLLDSFEVDRVKQEAEMEALEMEMAKTAHLYDSDDDYPDDVE